MSEKILIAEVSDNTVWYDYFPFYQNVWLVRTNNIYTDLASSTFELERRFARISRTTYDHVYYRPG